MNLEKITHEISEFTHRISQSLCLLNDDDSLIETQKFLCSWVKLQSNKIKLELEDYKKKNTGFIGGMMMLGLIKSQKNVKEIQILNEDLTNLAKHLKNRFIPEQFNFKSEQIPQDILQAVKTMKNKNWKRYYATIKGPFLKNKYINKREDFHGKIQEVCVNNLKLIMIQEKVAHKYQRNLVQEIFGRVLRSQGSLTMVLKIQVGDDPVEDPYFLYCYVQDTKFKEKYSWKPLNQLKISQTNLFIDYEGKKLLSYQENILQILLSQILILPVQTLVSNYIVKILPDKIELVKCNQQNQDLIIKQKGLKSHPSLRNPILYFTNTGTQKSAEILKMQSITNSEALYQCFYGSLNIMVQLIVHDFPCTTYNQKVLYSSLCFNAKTFDALWTSFHKIIGLKGWLKEVISPIKSTISSSQIFNHFCPIYNQLYKNSKDSLESSIEFIQNIDIESYLTTFIQKKTLQKYKNMYVDIDSDATLLKPVSHPKQAYEQIFKPVLEEVNLVYVNTIEAIYILDFVGKHKFLYQPNIENLPESWKNQKLWQKNLNFLKQNNLKFLDISFDIMAYHYGFDTFKADINSFERIKNTPENQHVLEALQEFIKLIRNKFNQKILSSLLEKAFKHKKYEICKKLLENFVRIRDFKDTFSFEEIMDPKYEELKEKIMKKIKQDSPQMHRIFRWQQLMLIELQKNGVEVETFDYGKCYIPEQILTRHIKNGKIVNNLSRKDYKFNSSREIAQIDTKHSKTFYLEKCAHPLLNYFYQIFFDNLGIPQLMPYFTTFFYQNKLFTLIEYIPDVIDYKKGLELYSEQELNIMTDQRLISMSILATMVLLPKQVHLRDILIQPSKNERDQLFILDLQTFYSKNFFGKSGSNIKLNCKNTLFTFDMMNKVVHPDIVKKFRDLDVTKFIGDCFEQYSELVKKVNKMKEANCDPEIPIQQFLGLIFENGFILNFAERLFKIKRIFGKKVYQKGISLIKILENLDSQIHDYYNEVQQTQNNALKREALIFDDNWKKPFVNSLSLLEFFGNFNRPEEQQYQFPEHYYKLCFNGPSESLSNFTNNLKKFNSFSNNIPNDLELYSNQYFQYYMKNADTSDSEIENRQRLMEVIKNKSLKYLQNPQKKLLPLTFIRVHSYENIKDKFIHSFSYERVQQLIFENCRISDVDINNMPKSIENILYLQLKDVNGLKYIGQNTLFGNVIQIKHLKVLSIVNCPQLVGVDIKCDILESIELKQNPVLENIYISSNFLNNIYCSQNPKINLENLGIYILKGINVLTCKTACRGDIMKIYQNTYDKYIINLLKFLLSRFFDSEARYFIILTLSKLHIIDDNLFTMAGITTFKGFSMFSKFTQQLQDKVLRSVIQIFYSNPYIKTLPTYLLTQPFFSSFTNQSMTIQRIFRLMSDTIRKNPNISHFNEIQIQKSSKPIPEKVSKNFVDLLEAIRFDKHVKISLINFAYGDNNVKNEDNQMSKSMAVTNVNQKLKSKSMSLSQNESITGSGNQDQNMKQIINVIAFLGAYKKGIQRLNLVFQGSTLNKQFFDRILIKGLEKQNPDTKEIKLQTKQEKPTSQKKIQQIAHKYKKGFQKMVDAKILKKNTLSQDQSKTISQQQQDEKLSKIRKIKIQNSKINQELLQTQGIFEQQIMLKTYDSIKELKLIQTEIYSSQFLEFMPNLTHIYLRNTQICFREEKLFSVLNTQKIKLLEISSFFKKNDSQNKCKMFCDFLKNARCLNTLIFLDNQITPVLINQLNSIINQTNIKEFSFNNLTLCDSQKSVELSDEEAVKIYENFLSDTQKLYSLTVGFKKEIYLEAFIISLSKNKSIIQLTFDTNGQISSKILQPLRKNDLISSIRSQNQLPTWLLTHIQSNTNTIYRKSKSGIIHEEIDGDLNAENQNLIDMLNTSSNKGADFHRIGLSLDGGGMRGLLLATQLHYLQKQVGKPLHKIFDCVGGTSIGGILSLAITGSHDGYHPVCDSSHLMQIFTKYGKDIFKKSQIRQFRNLFDTRYSPVSFEGVLKNYYKQTRLSDVLPDTSVIVTAVNRMDNKDYIFKSTEALLSSERDFYMRDVARATSAAPIYFPSAQIKNINATMKLSLLDGGMGMNNPSKLVIDEIKKMPIHSDHTQNFFLLSLGTGRLPCENIPEYAGLKDLSPIIDSFTESANYFTQRDLADHYKGHFIRVSPLINIQNKKQAQLDNTSDQVLKIYQDAGYQSAKKYFKNTVIFGKYRNMNLIEWLQQNTARKYDI